jgi:tetratricopeptide (TPR) repeat protein
VESPAGRDRALAIAIDPKDFHRAAAWVWLPEGLAAADRKDFAAAETAGARIAALLLQPHEADESPSLDAYLEIMTQMVGGLAAYRRGETETGIATVARAAARYESVPFDFGPPVPVKPPQELAGELLLEDGRPAEARAYFERSLKLAPRRVQSLLGLARSAAAAGDRAAAAAAYAELLQIWHAADADLPGKAQAVRFQQAPAAGHLP